MIRCLPRSKACSILCRTWLACATAGAAVALTSTVSAEGWASGQTGIDYDNNVTRADRRDDVRGDAAATVAATFGWNNALSGRDSIDLMLDARAAAYGRFHGLNDVEWGGGMDYRHKFGVGFDAAWASLWLGASHDNFSDALRDSDRLSIRAALGKRFAEAFEASLGFAYDRRYGKTDAPVVPGISGRVFAVQGQTVFVRASCDATERLQILGELSVRRGDVVATTRPNLAIFTASQAIAADPMFGDDFFAYRLRGTTDTASIALSWALTNRSSLNIGYVDARTRATQGLAYRDAITNLTLAFRY
jgi:hypothetical protein